MLPRTLRQRLAWSPARQALGDPCRATGATRIHHSTEAAHVRGAASASGRGAAAIASRVGATSVMASDFRRSEYACRSRSVLFTRALVIAALAGTCLQPRQAAAAEIVRAGQTFTCTPVAVYDGDGPVWCAERGIKIRIAGVAAREMDGTCRSNQPCPAVDATDARDRLVRILGGPRGALPQGHIVVRSATMTCRSEGSAGGSRTAAWCISPVFGDLSCAVVQAGGAVRWARFWRNHHC
jgi:endonuclease YncB( thermonuclease family)